MVTSWHMRAAVTVIFITIIVIISFHTFSQCGVDLSYVLFPLLQAEYKKAVTTNQWHRRLEFPSGETIVMHNPKVMIVTY